MASTIRISSTATTVSAQRRSRTGCVRAVAQNDVPQNVIEARQWIARWRSQRSSTALAASAASSGAPEKAPVPPNVAEAREWIARWRAKQTPSPAPAAPAAPKPAAEAPKAAPAPPPPASP
eukprot:CAMPEP_0202889782 /NCGR_PEP_ID=MMETSP1392-20130828/354_1 /ASSEMBLY_ACC=CAM_ASM_000868 /TAXON_ID=225041 /ORGANISM="Chlamydomonas chlamydogama, Strain SAG 11-48b" /LENGTH=120 /DNA_ID=CAMNT_0049573189 /DNA_START=123 /DNA_END=482 /DNA_ORIENTATION=+